jgi:ABC-type multidrug transport system fused ATPase/permease subunit
MEGRTTFIIAHRLSTLENCDFTLYLKGGRLVDIRRPGAERKPVEIAMAS